MYSPPEPGVTLTAHRYCPKCGALVDMAEKHVPLAPKSVLERQEARWLRELSRQPEPACPSCLTQKWHDRAMWVPRLANALGITRQAAEAIVRRVLRERGERA